MNDSMSRAAWRLVLYSLILAIAKAQNNQSTCTMDFVLKHCRPFRTFQICVNGSCICPTEFHPAVIKNDLKIDTYWDPLHRQCVSKINSICFYLPPSVLVSQPYRCVARNADCVQAPEQYQGVGICKCNGGYRELPSRDGCFAEGSQVEPVIISNSGGDNGTNYELEEPCNWKFQCPHMQECVNGMCECPRRQLHDNGYVIDMVWNKDDHVCESTKGSYCNNAKLHEPHKNLLIKSILKAMMEVRCVAGLKCKESTGLEMGICSTAACQMSRGAMAVGLFFLTVSSLWNYHFLRFSYE